MLLTKNLLALMTTWLSWKAMLVFRSEERTGY